MWYRGTHERDVIRNKYDHTVQCFYRRCFSANCSSFRLLKEELEEHHANIKFCRLCRSHQQHFAHVEADVR